jgi:hypothetical protein
MESVVLIKGQAVYVNRLIHRLYHFKESVIPSSKGGSEYTEVERNVSSFMESGRSHRSMR